MLRLFLWLGSRLFEFVDIYSPDKEKVVAITFSSSEKYIDKVTKL